MTISPIQTDPSQIASENLDKGSCKRRHLAYELDDPRVDSILDRYTPYYVSDELGGRYLSLGDRLQLMSIDLDKAQCGEEAKYAAVLNYIRGLMHSCPTHPEVVKIAIELNALMSIPPKE